jgi:RHS repeat-associated protein
MPTGENAMDSNQRLRIFCHSTVWWALVVASLPAGASTRIHFVHSDHLGTPQALTDAQQRVVWQAHYRPFGEAEVDEDSDGDGHDTRLNLRFAGQYYDESTRLHYNYFRDYNPGNGRYVQSDPLGLVAGPNTYAYVGGNPVLHNDPYGLCPWCVGAAIGAFTGGVSSYSGALATGADWRDAAILGTVGAFFGGLAGGVGGFGVVGSSLLGGASNITAQVWAARTDEDPCNDVDINRGSVVGSMIGGGWSNAITRAASAYSGRIVTAYSSTVLGWGPGLAASTLGTEIGN